MLSVYAVDCCLRARKQCAIGAFRHTRGALHRDRVKARRERNL